MSIKFIMGTSGSGKTYFARKKAAELAASNQRVAILVPEQFSFETERAMLDYLQPSMADLVEVYSFTRLSNKVSREVGGIAGKRLDDSGRAAVMSVALGQIRDNLSLYASQKKGQEFVSEMLNAVNEFKSCAISPKMLLDAASSINEKVLKQKLQELSLIYEAYNSYVTSSKSIDPLDDLSRLAKNLEENDYFGGTTIIVDSFTGFTGQELQVLKRIIAQCDDFIITLCCDDDKHNELFSSINHTADILSSFDSNVSFEYLRDNKRFASPELNCIEKSIFRPVSQIKYDDISKNVSIYSALDKYDETEFTARQIRKMVRENGLRWKDFAIICRNASDYQNEMLMALEQQNIPYFCDKRTPITQSPVIRFVLAAFDTVLGGWKIEDVFRWLKTGMINQLSMVDIAKLEDYCFIWNIKGKSWQNEFTQSPNGYTAQKNDGDDEALEKLNSSRKIVTDILNKFTSAAAQRNVKGIDLAAAIFEMLDTAESAKCIERMIPFLSANDADEQGQIWNSLMGVLDQIADILGDTVLSPQEFYDLFTLMIGFCDIGKIPQSMDQVVFGSADRIRTSEPKAVFVLGANDGVFPMTSTESGIFTESERKELISVNLPITGDADETAISEQYLAYNAVTCSSEKVFVSFSNVCNGEALYCSELVTEIIRIVPNCTRLNASREVTLDMIESADAGFLLAAKCINDNTELSASLTQVYNQRSEYSDKLKVIGLAGKERQQALQNKSNAYSLFGKNIRISASKAECFYNCRFMYFCKYGMKAFPRKRAELNPLEYGNVIHFVLEKLLKRYDLSSLTDDDKLVEKINVCLDEYLNEVMGGVDMKSARFLYLFRRLSETLVILVTQLCEEFAKSLFRPEAFELPIENNNEIINGEALKPLKIRLSDNTEITVGGKIDRVDVYNNGDKRYVRVVDYKTGNKEFLLSDILSGLNMQMLIYLDILCGDYSEQSPAGIIYSPASIGKINGIRGQVSFDDERQNALKKNGLIIDDSDVINAMEEGMEKKIDKKSNASVKGGKTFHAPATYVADREQFAEIRAYVRHLLREMGEALHNGDISAFPAKGLYDACAYCEYQTLCTSEQKEKGRDIEKKDMASTLDIIKKECDENV